MMHGQKNIKLWHKDCSDAKCLVRRSHANVSEFAWFERGKLRYFPKKFPTTWETEFLFTIQMLRHEDYFIFLLLWVKRKGFKLDHEICFSFLQVYSSLFIYLLFCFKKLPVSQFRI